MKKINDDWIVPTWPAPKNIKAVCTTRGDATAGRGFNLALHVDDDRDWVLENRQQLKTLLNLSAEPAWLQQTHSNTAVKAGSHIDADASFTDEKNVACVVLTADCLPILLCNKQGTKVAAIHAGWRGLANGIIESTITAMKTPGEELLAWLGPAIGPEKFQVGPEVRETFLQLDPDNAIAFTPDHEGKYKADIFKLAEIQLQKRGVSSISSPRLCTYTDNKRFFSYRRDGAHTGRMATLIWIDKL